LKILVTGGTGFIGSHLAKSLVDSKYGYKIAVLKRSASQLKGLESFKNNIQIYPSDTYSDIEKALKNFIPDMVIHAAACMAYKPHGDEIFDLINANITFGTYLLDVMTENHVHKFLNIATRWQHVGNKRYCPANLYAATKEAFRDILIYYEKKGITHKTIELCDTYGMGDTRKKILDLLIDACRNKTALDLTPGEQLLDLSCVDDICAYIVSHITRPGFFDNKIIAWSGEVIALRDLGALVEKKFNAQGVLNWGARPYRENEVMAPPRYYRTVYSGQESLESYIDGFVET
jgi:nucleoside-diphosphate-sugar epimerase